MYFTHKILYNKILFSLNEKFITHNFRYIFLTEIIYLPNGLYITLALENFVIPPKSNQRCLFVKCFFVIFFFFFSNLKYNSGKYNSHKIQLKKTTTEKLELNKLKIQLGERVSQNKNDTHNNSRQRFK